MSLLERAQAHSVSSPCPRLSFVTLFSLRVGIRGEKAKRGRLSLPPHTHIPLRNTPVRDPPLPLQPPPQNIFISIIKQFFYMLIHQSGLGLICKRGAGWCVPLPLFRCARLPGRHLSRYMWHTKPLPCQH